MHMQRITSYVTHLMRAFENGVDQGNTGASLLAAIFAMLIAIACFLLMNAGYVLLIRGWFGYWL
jgi:hypothetical protein